MADILDNIAKENGLDVTDTMAKMRTDLYDFMQARGWDVTGCGYGASQRWEGGTCMDISVCKGKITLWVEVHEFEVNA